MTSVTTSIVYTDPLQRNPTSSALQPFFISVSFLGSLPPHILTGEIPLQISVSLPQEYASFTSPVLMATPSSPAIEPASTSIGDLEDLSEECTSLSSLVLRATQSTPAIEPASVSIGDLQYPSETNKPPKCNLTFLPLPRDFDFAQGEDWVALAKHIQDWLLMVVLDTHSQEWLWGCEVFWIVFIAAYPLFPLESWLMWDLKISLEESFIQSWMDRMSVDGLEADSKDVVSLAEGLSAEALGNICADLWEEFRCTVSLFYLHELIGNI